MNALVGTGCMFKKARSMMKYMSNIARMSRHRLLSIPEVTIYFPDIAEAVEV